jgi:hypothetical protein
VWLADFEDMSCEMIYGQAPPPLEEDPALQQPCFLAGPTACKSNPSKTTVSFFPDIANKTDVEFTSFLLMAHAFFEQRTENI